MTTHSMLTLAEAHAMLPGSTLVGDAGVPFARVHSDTRSLQAGDLFVALKGERFDAHAVAADRLDEGLEVGGRGDDGERGAAPRGGGGGAPQERGAEKRPQHLGLLFGGED